jgi:hypothetical protein
VLLGAVSGSIAPVVSNPFFLLKSRFQAVGSEDVLHQHLHPSLRCGYMGYVLAGQVIDIDAMSQSKVPGIKGLFDTMTLGDDGQPRALHFSQLGWERDVNSSGSLFSSTLFWGKLGTSKGRNIF